MTQLDYKWLQLYKLWLDKVLVSEIHLLVHLNVRLSDVESEGKWKPISLTWKCISSFRSVQSLQSEARFAHHK